MCFQSIGDSDNLKSDSLAYTGSGVGLSDIPVTKAQTDTEMIDIRKLMLKLILKRFSMSIYPVFY